MLKCCYTFIKLYKRVYSKPMSFSRRVGWFKIKLMINIIHIIIGRCRITLFAAPWLGIINSDESLQRILKSPKLRDMLHGNLLCYKYVQIWLAAFSKKQQFHVNCPTVYHWPYNYSNIMLLLYQSFKFGLGPENTVSSPMKATTKNWHL